MLKDGVPVAGARATVINGHTHFDTSSHPTGLSASFFSPHPLLGRDVINDVIVAMPTDHQARGDTVA